MKVNSDDFTEIAWQGIIDAKNLALNENHQTLETEHLLYSLLKKNEIAIKILEKAGISIKNLLLQTEVFIKKQRGSEDPRCYFYQNYSKISYSEGS